MELQASPDINVEEGTIQTTSEEFGVEERQMMCPPGRAGKRCRKNLGEEEEIEKRQMMCPPGKAGRRCRKNMGEEE